MSHVYAVPGPFYAMKQPTGMSCWATVGTMMMAWRNHQSLSIEGAMSLAGQRWADLFASGRGLRAADHGAFVTACGMRHEQLMCFSMDGWLGMLRQHGPLAVVTANPFHARIIISMNGNGDPDQTSFMIIDPARGNKYRVNFRRFTRDFEAVARSPRYQVWHY